MIKIPISGPPHSGKTTVFESLKHEYPEAHFVEEPAERVIAWEQAKAALDPEYEAVVPFTNYPAFVPMVIAESEALELAIPPQTELVFQDRCLIDNIGYGTMYGYHEYIPKVQRLVDVANYAFALFCEPVGIYTNTEIRHEDAETAKRLQDHLAEAYDNSGIEVVHLPAVSNEERLAIIRAKIETIETA